MTGIRAGHGYARSGSLDVHYDVEGTGPPLLLFHGGMGTASMFGDLRGRLNQAFTTIAVEQQGHGHTADVDRPLRFDRMADDSAAVIRHLELSRCHAFGYSDGGNVALGLAIRYPDLVDRIAICGTNANNDGLDPAVRDHLIGGARKDPAEVAASIPAILRDAYLAAALVPGNWPLLVHRVFELAASFEGWSEEQLQSVRSPILVMAGDRDVVTVEHAVWLTRQLDKGQLCILPRTDHLAPISRSAWVATILHDFLTDDLDAPLPMQAAHD